MADYEYRRKGQNGWGPWCPVPSWRDRLIGTAMESIFDDLGWGRVTLSHGTEGPLQYRKAKR